MLAYVFDEVVKHEVNSNRKNCWDVYINEINELLGIRAQAISLGELEDVSGLKEIKTLIIGSEAGSRITDSAREILDEWVYNGGMLIGFAVKGMDSVFGINSCSCIKQLPDDYAISGYFDLRPHAITNGIHPVLFIEQKLIMISDIQLIDLKGSIELGHLYDTAGTDLKRPAITWHKHGNGYAGYFAFDAAKTVWVLHQGKPPGDVPEEGRFPKTNVLQVLGENSRKIPYADEIVFIIQNMIARNMQPFIYQIPPCGTDIPDALFYWGGDEYAGPVGRSLGASDWMNEKGLPYHINIEIENHPMTVEEFRHIRDNGHEVSAYYLLDENNRMTEERIREQYGMFYKKFGCRPVCTLNNCCRWKGWAEPARWMADCGGKADNSFSGCPLPYTHPASNTPNFSFGYGTSYPFHFYDDYKRGNERIDFIEEPIVCYELGHRCVKHEGDIERVALEDIHLPIDMAIYYHFVMNMFYHPIYIVNSLAKKAIEGILEYIQWRKALVVHMSNNQVCEWWEARSRSNVHDIDTDGNCIVFSTECSYQEGMIVKILLERHGAIRTASDGKPLPWSIRREFGGEWLYIVIPQGKHRIEVRLE